MNTNNDFTLIYYPKLSRHYVPVWCVVKVADGVTIRSCYVNHSLDKFIKATVRQYDIVFVKNVGVTSGILSNS